MSKRQHGFSSSKYDAWNVNQQGLRRTSIQNEYFSAEITQRRDRRYRNTLGIDETTYHTVVTPTVADFLKLTPGSILLPSFERLLFNVSNRDCFR
jgi:hypothetical protein